MKIPALILAFTLCAVAQEHKIGVTRYELPIYPPIARAARIQGQVKVTFLVDSARKTSFKSISGHPMLKIALQEPLKNWHLICLTCAWGTQTEHTMTFEFALNESGTVPQRYSMHLPTSIQIISEPLVISDPPPIIRHSRGPRCLYLWHCG